MSTAPTGPTITKCCFKDPAGILCGKNADPQWSVVVPRGEKRIKLHFCTATHLSETTNVMRLAGEEDIYEVLSSSLKVKRKQYEYKTQAKRKKIRVNNILDLGEDVESDSSDSIQSIADMAIEDMDLDLEM